MAFPEDIVKQAWKKSGEKCECQRASCRHLGKCGKILLWQLRGSENPQGWEAHHINSQGSDSLDNCEILCQPCHKNTQSYGG